MSTKIIKCACKHEYQDKTYGEGNRVHIVKAKGVGPTQYTCTVCGKIK